MKKIYALTIVCLALCLFTPAVHADAWYKLRNKCNLLYKRYKTQAWVSQWVVGGSAAAICRDTDKDCNLAESDCFYFDRSYTGAYAIAGDRITLPRTDGGFTVTLYNTGYADYYIVRQQNNPVGDWPSAGFNRILLPADQTSYFITRPKTIDKIDNDANISRGYIYHEGGTPTYDYENRTITISGIVGSLQMGVSDLTNGFSALTISVTHEPTTYKEDEDPYVEEKNYLNNLIWSSTAMLNNGRVLMDGVFNSSNFSVIKNDGQKSRVEVKMNVDKSNSYP